MGKTTTLTDFQFFAKIMPNYYVTSAYRGNNEVWRCRSNIGIPDEEKWDIVAKAFQQRWPGRYLQINHITCTNHVYFDLVLKSDVI